MNLINKNKVKQINIKKEAVISDIVHIIYKL